MRVYVYTHTRTGHGPQLSGGHERVLATEAALAAAAEAEGGGRAVRGQHVLRGHGAVVPRPRELQRVVMHPEPILAHRRGQRCGAFVCMRVELMLQAHPG